MSIKELEKRIKSVQSESTQGLHLFSSENRRAVFRELSRLPCQTSSSIGAHLNIEPRVAEWHLKKLHDVGLVEVWNEKKRFYFIPELVDFSDLPLFSLLNRKAVKYIIRYAVSGCSPVSDLKVPSSSFYKYAHELEQLDMIYISGTQRKYLCGTERLRKLVEKYEEKGINFKKYILKVIEIPGFNVRVAGIINNELKIEVRGLENFSMGVYISPLQTAMEV